MLAKEITEIVASSPFLAGLEPAEIHTFIEQGRLRHAQEGAYLFHQGDFADTFYILSEGRVRLLQLGPDGNQVTLSYFGPGDGLGIIVALSEMPYPASAEVIEDSTTLSWNRYTTQEMMLQMPQLALNGMELIAGRFAQLQELYFEMATQRVEQRIALTLLRLARQFGKRIEDGVLIDMSLSRQELADMTGTNIYNVSRILSKWEQAGIVRTGRREVTLCKAHQLILLTEGPHPN